MPLLDVEIVRHPGEQFGADLAAQLANGAGQIFASSPGNTWVKVQFMANVHILYLPPAAGRIAFGGNVV